MSTSTADPVACEPRTAFVLAGGAALGAMQAGMVHALYERGIAPDLLIGTSAGALNAAFLASRPPTVATAEQLAALWRGLRRTDVLPLRPATLLGGLAGRCDHLIPDQALRRLDGPAVDAVLAAAAIPGVLPPVRWRGRLLADGGIADNTRSRTPSRSAPGASTCCPPRTPATAACRARPGPRWPLRCTQSPC